MGCLICWNYNVTLFWGVLFWGFTQHRHLFIFWQKKHKNDNFENWDYTLANWKMQHFTRHDFCHKRAQMEINANTPSRETVFSKMATRDINSSCMALWWWTKSATRLKSSSWVCRDGRNMHWECSTWFWGWSLQRHWTWNICAVSQQAKNISKQERSNSDFSKKQNNDCCMGGTNLSNVQRLCKPIVKNCFSDPQFTEQILLSEVF